MPHQSNIFGFIAAVCAILSALNVQAHSALQRIEFHLQFDGGHRIAGEMTYDDTIAVVSDPELGSTATNGIQDLKCDIIGPDAAVLKSYTNVVSGHTNYDYPVFSVRFDTVKRQFVNRFAVGNDPFLELKSSPFYNPNAPEIVSAPDEFFVLGQIQNEPLRSGFELYNPKDGSMLDSASGPLVVLTPGLPPQITITNVRNERVEISFVGTLYTSQDLRTWIRLDPQPQSPFTLPIIESRRYFRASW